jgi:hypothetical protein
MVMASKKTPAATPPTDSTNTLKIETDGKKSRPRLLAELALAPEFKNASTTRKYVASIAGELDFTELMTVMREKTAQVKAGDLSGLEATLTAQAVLLDGIFNELARRAALNMTEYLNAADTYLRLALKAQSQCRTTIEAIAEIKNPRPVAFVRQANIAHGPQQVNNGPAATPSRAGNSQNQSNELSGAIHELLPDTGASALAGRANPQLETVGEIDRTTNASGQGQERRQ